MAMTSLFSESEAELLVAEILIDLPNLILQSEQRGPHTTPWGGPRWAHKRKRSVPADPDTGGEDKKIHSPPPPPPLPIVAVHVSNGDLAKEARKRRRILMAEARKERAPLAKKERKKAVAVAEERRRKLLTWMQRENPVLDLNI